MSETMTVNWTFDLAGELTHRYDAVHWFPFVEDENANITGPGHQDKAAFARMVDQFDEVASGEARPEDERWTADQITHRWVVPPEVTAEDPEGLYTVAGVTQDTPGAIPVTTLWGVR
jgi:hypothetical protein